MSTRAGRDLMQPIGSRGFIPAPLPAANTLVAKLEKLENLQKITGQARNRRFRFGPYIAHFSEGGP